MTHKLKIWPGYYSEVSSGSKTYEVRKNDRNYKCGDTVVLQEYDPVNGYTANELTFEVGYVLKLDLDIVVFSLIKIKGAKNENT